MRNRYRVTLSSRQVCLLLVWVAGSELALAGDWPMFRGPMGNGITDEPHTPIQWSATENVLWKTPLTRPGNGSPIVVGNRVLVSLAEDDDGKQRSLICLDAQTGNSLWTRNESYHEKMPTHSTNPYGGTTPASDGQRVVVWHASAGLFVYSIEGSPLWSRTDLGEFRHMWGYGTSPIIVGDRVILHTGPGKRVFVSAFELATGKTLWSHEEPIEGNGETNPNGKYMGSWATPVPYTHMGRQVVVCAMAKRVCAWDVSSGQLVWSCAGIAGPKGDLAYSSPLCEKDLCVANAGFQGPAFAFRMVGIGDLTDNHRLWRNEQNPQSIGTGLLLDGIAYRVGAGAAVLQCVDGATGKQLWQDRGVGGNYWGSISFNGKLAYATDQNGTTLVFEPSKDGLKQIAANKLGAGDHCNSTPALANGRIYIRTDKDLWCLGIK